ncbi:hypothetical protein [Halorubrum halodurans]|uniref:Uncharacterized protein n=1 Tax=Halorubrum halodurans TaxID=1383851 RepID=A0A256INQ8_9EURY|nr:hypothetical protein [Halorubrum halodurans]OYR58161.1 hypothetical protein DJ70_03925 [Halorubrum halodurans]
MGFDPDELPVVTLFRGKTFNGLTRHILDAEEIPTEWFRMTKLGEDIGVSSTASQNMRDQAVAYGLLEPSTDDDSARMPRYRIPDSPTVQLLRSFHTEYDSSDDPTVSDGMSEVVLPDLMESNGRARLIGWFLAAADIDEKYSISKMADVTPVGHTTVRDHIDSLVEYGIVTTHEASRGSQTYTTYQFNPKSTVATVLYDLNETLAHQRQQYNEQ